jgi:hypothetical protein
MRSDHSSNTRPFRAAPAPAALALAALALVPSAALAQAGPELPALSPRAKAEQRVGVTDFSIEYSSPGVKGRQIWGGLVPHDELWRAGANAATKLTASRDFTFGGTAVPAGSYAYYAIPGPSSWTVILNTNANAAGTAGYDEAKDVARVTVTPQPLTEPRERLAYHFDDATDDSVSLDLEWEKLRVRVPITVDTKAHVAASIDKALADAWRPHFASARYLLDSGGDLGEALRLIDTSIGIKPTWWNNWIRAQVLAKQGKKPDAVKAARRAAELGPGDSVYDGFFKGTIAESIAAWQK